MGRRTKIIICILTVLVVFISMMLAKMQNDKRNITTEEKNIENLLNVNATNEIDKNKLDDICQFIENNKNNKSIKYDFVDYVFHRHSISYNFDDEELSCYYSNFGPIVNTLYKIYPDDATVELVYKDINHISDNTGDSTQDIADEDTEQNNTSSSSNTNNILLFLGRISPFLVILTPFIIFNIIVANLISKDAKKRNMNSSNWWWSTFFFGLIAIILYVIVRDPRKTI
ncbi:hypothetical protein ACFHWD_04135 [Clostridium sp. MT-14]|uniref:hypothetical protein n=1 Tax=Clostridium sp. MT-14 TaxID=3348360 RepID=UPI0035F454A6